MFSYHPLYNSSRVRRPGCPVPFLAQGGNKPSLQELSGEDERTNHQHAKERRRPARFLQRENAKGANTRKQEARDRTYEGIHPHSFRLFAPFAFSRQSPSPCRRSVAPSVALCCSPYLPLRPGRLFPFAFSLVFALSRFPSSGGGAAPPERCRGA